MNRVPSLLLPTALVSFIWTLHGSPLLPYGPSQGSDTAEIDLLDDDYFSVTLTTPILFFGTSYTSARIVTNGFIAFNGVYDDYCCSNEGFPYLDHTKIAPLWIDLYPGSIYYRQSATADDLKMILDDHMYHHDTDDLRKRLLKDKNRWLTFAECESAEGKNTQAATNHIRSLFTEFDSFQATWVLVVTWHEFALYRERTAVNTFQTVLATDGTVTFAIYLYENVEKLDTGHGMVGADAGDGVNYYYACMSRTPLLLDIETTAIKCGGTRGVIAFRIDAINLDQENYICTPSSTNGNPNIPASYYCRWTDATETAIEVNFKMPYTWEGVTRSVMAYDTQKYLAGENPILSDPNCETLTTESDIISLSFQVDPVANVPACGVTVTGSSPKTLDITVRTWSGNSGDRLFDTECNPVFRFTCTTDKILPATAEVDMNFGLPETATIIPVLERSATLQVIVPDTQAVLAMAQVGQLIQLRLIYDNTPTNAEPYGIYVPECTVAGTAEFDENIIDLISDGCVTEQGFMSGSFSQTSLSPAGLFISDSGTMKAFRFLNRDKHFFRCVIGFCFWASATEPNLCTNSCPARRKRSDSFLEKDTEVVFANIVIKDPQGEIAKDIDGDICGENISSRTVYIVTGVLGFLDISAFICTLFIFRKLLRALSSKQHRTQNK